MVGRFFVLILLLVLPCITNAMAEDVPKIKLDEGKQLIVAAFELDVERVKLLLEKGANPNSRFGSHDDPRLFEDKWTLGSPIGSNKWTPLIAVAHSHREPQPEQRTENTIAGLEAAAAKRKAIDPKLIDERNKRRLSIARLLIDAKAQLDLDDGYGATALYKSIYHGYEDLALLLISCNAGLDTKTRIYIDGTDDITPVHRATGYPKILEAMIQRGVNVNVSESSGDTPLHWATISDNVAAVKLLLEAGANPTAKDKNGHTPSYWCQTSDRFEFRGDEKKKEITKLLEKAAKDDRSGK